MKRFALVTLLMICLASAALAASTKNTVSNNSFRYGLGAIMTDTVSAASFKAYFTDNFSSKFNLGYTSQSNNTSTLLIGVNPAYVLSLSPKAALEIGGDLDILSGQNAGQGYSTFALSFEMGVEYFLEKNLSISVLLYPLGYNSTSSGGATTTTTSLARGAAVAGYYYF